jgi:hypothetical protein
LFQNIHASHRLKLTDKWSIYLPTYERLLSPHVSQPWRILEIGVQNGGSLEVWAHFFPCATHIVGCDNDPACANLGFDDPRIAVIVGDANADATELAIAGVAAQFDFIVDDGSHRSSDIVRSFARYFPRLADGGLYVVEDLHCSYWAGYEGGVLHPTSSMGFFKRLADVVNHEHWGIPNRRGDLFASFASQYGIALDEDLLAHVHSIEFVNSICVVRRRAPAENLLGQRVVLGAVAAVQDEPRALHGTAHRVPDQTGNTWSVLDPLPEIELPALRARSAQLSDALQALHARHEAERLQLEALLPPQIPQRPAGRLTLEGRMQRIVSDLAAAQQNLDERDGQLSLARRHILHLRERLATGRAHSLDLSRALMAERDNLCATRHRLLQTEHRLHGIEASLWWRFGAPLRSLARVHQRISRVAQRLARVASHEGGAGTMLRGCGLALGRSGIGGLRRYLRQTETVALRMTMPDPTSDPDPAPDDAMGREVFDRQQNEFSPAELGVELAAFRVKPLISVIMLGRDLPAPWIQGSVQSLQDQAYDHWELCIPCAALADDEASRLLAEFSIGDERIRIGPRDAGGAGCCGLNAAALMARGPWVALLEAGDTLTHDALQSIVRALNETPQAQLLYSDECRVHDSRERRLTQFQFKLPRDAGRPVDSPWPGRLAVHETSALRAVAGPGDAAGLSPEQVLAICAGRQPLHVVHVKRLLYLGRPAHSETGCPPTGR